MVRAQEVQRLQREHRSRAVKYEPRKSKGFRNAIESRRVALVTTHGLNVHGWPGTFSGGREEREEERRTKSSSEVFPP